MIYNPVCRYVLIIIIPEPETAAVLARGSRAWLLSKEFMNPDMFVPSNDIQTRPG